MAAGEAPESWRIVVFTDMPVIAANYPRILGAKGHQVVGVVTSRKRNFGYVDVVSSAPPTADVIVSDRPRHWAKMIAPLRPDLIIATVFPWRIPQDVIDAAPLGAINLHPSVLPKYRGTMTPNWTLLNDERTTGLTVHRMVSEFDAGPILAQVEIEVTDDDDLMSMTQRLFTHAPTVIHSALDRVAAGDPGDPQDESQSTYYGTLPDDVRIIDWNSPARQIHNQVRGLAAFVHPSGAQGTIDGVPCRILKSRLVVSDGASGSAAPGTIVSRDESGVTIQCGDGLLQVLHYEPL